MCCGIGFGFWNCQSKFYGYALNYRSSGLLLTMRDVKKENKYYAKQRAKQLQGGDEELIEKGDSSDEEEKPNKQRKQSILEKILPKKKPTRQHSSQFSLMDDEDVVVMDTTMYDSSEEEFVEEEVEQMRQMKQRLIEENTNKQIKNREAKSWTEMFTNTFVTQFFVATNNVDLLLNQVAQVKEEMDKF